MDCRYAIASGFISNLAPTEDEPSSGTMTRGMAAASNSENSPDMPEMFWGVETGVTPKSRPKLFSCFLAENRNKRTSNVNRTNLTTLSANKTTTQPQQNNCKHRKNQLHAISHSYRVNISRDL